MSNSGNSKSNESALKEQLRKLLKRNRTPTYTPDEEGGTFAGPTDRDNMKKQAEEDDEQRKK